MPFPRPVPRTYIMRSSPWGSGFDLLEKIPLCHACIVVRNVITELALSSYKIDFMWAWWWIGQLESRSVERGCFHGHCTYTIYSHHTIILSSLVVRSSWVLLHMTAVSCSDFLQRPFMNKTQRHFIHYKLAGCFAIIIQQFKAICWVMFILYYFISPFMALVSFQ